MIASIITDTPLMTPAVTGALLEAAGARLVTQICGRCQVFIQAAPPGLMRESAELLQAALFLKALPPPLQHQVVFHPEFHHCLHALRRLQPQHPAARWRQAALRLSRVLWPLSLSAPRRDPWLVIADDQGGLPILPSERFVELGAPLAGQPISVAVSGAEVQLHLPDGSTVHTSADDLLGRIEQPAPTISEHGFAISQAPRLSQGVPSWSRHACTRVRFTGTNQRTDGIDFYTPDSAWFRTAPQLAVYSEALEVIAEVWPDQMNELARLTRVLVPMESGERSLRRAFTVSSRQGAVFADPMPSGPLSQCLVHENAHIKLRNIQHLDPLIRTCDEARRFAVPWRPDPRPLSGILEGVYVFSHEAELERRRLALTRWSGSRLQAIQHGLKLLEHADLTPNGEHLVQIIHRWVDESAAS